MTAPVIANTTFGSYASAASGNLSVTRAAGEGFLVCVYAENDFVAQSDPSSVVWDSAGDNQSLTAIDSQLITGGTRKISAWYLAAPTSAKTGNITVTTPDANDRVGIEVRHITGHDTSSMVRGSGKDSGTSFAPSSTVLSATDDLVVDFVGIRNDIIYLSADSPQADEDKHYVNSVASRSLLSSSKAGASSVTMSWTDSGGGSGPFGWGSISVAVQPAGSGGGATTLTAGAGSFTETGVAATLKAARKLSASAGSFALTGQTVALTGPGSKTLTAGTGSFTLTGQDANFEVAVEAGIASYTLTGQAAGLKAGRKVSASAASFALTGQGVTLSRTRSLAAGSGIFALTGKAVTLTFQGVVVASSPGTATLSNTGASATLSNRP